jgi:amino acid transporter
MWLCGFSSITSMSRMWFAFARDGGMPGHKLISQVHHKWRTPMWSIIITSILAVLLTIYSAVYSVIVAVSTTALYLAYAIPIYLNARNKMQKKGEYATPETAPWSLKGWAPILNWISVAWIIFITILFSIPPNELAGWSMIILVVFMVLYWQLDAKKRFTGPKPTAEVELRKLEAEMTQGDD